MGSSATAQPRAGVVAIDGPSGSGKSTVARGVAERLGMRYLDSGAMYRAATWAVLHAAADPQDPDQVLAVVDRSHIECGSDPREPRTTVDGADVSAAIRGPAVTAAVSTVAAIPRVRRRLVAQQRAVVEQALEDDCGIVVEGRDIGSVVVPDARVKVYLTARRSVRAERRAVEVQATGQPTTADEQAADLARRDAYDSSRDVSPLAVPSGAVVIDSSSVPAERVVDQVVELYRMAGHPPPPIVRPVASMRPWARRTARWIGQVIVPRLLTIRLSGAEHLPLQGPVLVAGNHTGFLDGPLLWAAAPREGFFLVKSELYHGPLAHGLSWIGQIPVSRGRADRTALRSALAVLRRGEMLGMFPEGTRGEGDLRTIQHGVGWLALRAGCPVVPVACFGTLDAMPKGKRVPRRSKPVDLVLGPPLDVHVEGDPHTRAAVAAAAEQIRAGLAAHVEAAARATGRVPQAS